MRCGASKQQLQLLTHLLAQLGRSGAAQHGRTRMGLLAHGRLLGRSLLGFAASRAGWSMKAGPKPNQPGKAYLSRRCSHANSFDGAVRGSAQMLQRHGIHLAADQIARHCSFGPAFGHQRPYPSADMSRHDSARR